MASFQTPEHFQVVEAPSCSAGYSPADVNAALPRSLRLCGRYREALCHLTDWVFHCKVIFTPLIRALKEYCLEPEQQAPRQSQSSLTPCPHGAKWTAASDLLAIAISPCDLFTLTHTYVYIRRVPWVNVGKIWGGFLGLKAIFHSVPSPVSLCVSVIPATSYQDAFNLEIDSKQAGKKQRISTHRSSPKL